MMVMKFYDGRVELIELIIYDEDEHVEVEIINEAAEIGNSKFASRSKM